MPYSKEQTQQRIDANPSHPSHVFPQSWWKANRLLEQMVSDRMTPEAWRDLAQRDLVRREVHRTYFEAS